MDLFRAETLHLRLRRAHRKASPTLPRPLSTCARYLRTIDAHARGHRTAQELRVLSSDHQRSFTDVDHPDALIPKVDFLVIDHEGDARELDWKTLRSMTGGAALKGQGFSPEWFSFLRSPHEDPLHAFERLMFSRKCCLKPATLIFVGEDWEESIL